MSKESKVASRELAVTEKQLSKTARGAIAGSGAFRGLGRSVAFASATFLGAAGFIHVVTASVHKAIELQAALDETAVVFGKNGKAVEAWSRGLVKNFGLAGGEALVMANDVGQMLKGLDVAPGKAAQMSKSVVELASNIGALRHTDPAGFVKAFDQALAGRTRGLKAYGIFIDDTRIKAEALSLGLVHAAADTGKVETAQTKVAIAEAKLAQAEKAHGANSVAAASARLQLKAAEEGLAKAVGGSVPELTRAQKAQAIYSLTLKASGDATDYFRKHSDRADLVSKRLHASIANVQEEAGKALLPAITAVADATADWLSKEENQEKVTRTVAGAMHTLSEIVKDAVPIIQGAWHAADKVAGALGGWKRTLELLLALKVASWLTGMTGGFTLLAGSKSAGLMGARMESAALLLTLRRLATIGAIAITIDLLVNKDDRDFLINLGKTLGEATGIPALGRLLNPHSKQPTKAEIEAQGKVSGQATFSAGAANTLPSSFTATHQTLGLAGFPAVDIFHTPGTVIGSPVDGVVVRLSGRPWSAGWSNGPGSAIGFSIYIQADNGDTYFLTHFASVLVKPGQGVKRGQPIGVVGDMGGSSHIHEGVHRAGTVTPSAPTGATTKPSTSKTAPLTTGGSTTRPDITKIPAALRLQISRAEGTSGTLIDDRTAQRALLKVYLARLKKPGLTTDERADLQDAINETRKNIAEINNKIRDAMVEGAAKVGAETVLSTKLAAARRRILAAATKGARGGLAEGSSVLGTLLGFDQTASFQLQDKFGRAVTVTIAQVVARVKVLLNNLDKAIASGNVKAIQAAVKAWDGYADTIGSAVQAGTEAAAAKLAAAQAKLQTALGRVGSRIFTAFDRETQRSLAAMRSNIDTAVKSLQTDLAAKISRLQSDLQRQTDRITRRGAALTPEEQALRDFENQRAAEQAAQDRADANAIEDPVERARRLRELDLADQEAALQKAADLSRVARDKDTADEIAKLQKVEAAREQALQDQEAAQEQALQDAAAAREQDYQDQRDAQRQLLQDEFDAQVQALIDGTETWDDFIAWLQGKGASGVFGSGLPDPVAAMARAGQTQGSAFADAYIAELQRAADAQAELAGTTAPDLGSRPGSGNNSPSHLRAIGGFAAGGKIPGRYIGREDTVFARVTPGETVIDRRLTKALEQMVMGGRGGAQPIVVTGNTFLGGTERQVNEALARGTEPYRGRISSYPSPL